jgi:hypothetical protein
MYAAFEAQQDFPRVVAATLAAAQLEFDPLSSVDISHDPMLGVTLRSPDGTTDIFVNDLQRWRDQPSPLETPATQEPFYLRDLLPYKVGQFAVRVGSSNTGIRQHSVTVKVASSPQGFNSAQVSLGRTPGEDAIKVVRTTLQRPLKAGDWIDSHTRMEHLVADVTSGLATHDMNPFEHLQSLYATAPELCRAIQQTAIGLTSRFGDRVHDPESSPREARDFMRGVDDWQIYTRTLVWIMHNMDENMEHSSDSQLATVEEVVADKGQVVAAHTFRRLGLVAVDASSSEILATTRSVTAATFKNLASMYTHLEDVRPIPDLTASQKSHRRKTWGTISTSLAQLETPIRSIYA